MNVTTDDIFHAKLQHGDVFVHEIPGVGSFVYRPLPVREYQPLIDSPHLDQGDLEETLCALCLLDPPPPLDFDAYPVTVPTVLAQHIVESSTFQSPDTLLEAMDEARTALDTNTLEFLLAKICQVFTSYTPRQLEHLTLRQLLHELARAEKVSGGQKILTPKLFQGKRAAHIPAPPPPSMPESAHGKKWTNPSVLQDTGMLSAAEALEAALRGDIPTTPVGTRPPV